LYWSEEELLRQLFDANIPLLEFGMERPVACVVP
jgi:hypothetical protein